MTILTKSTDKKKLLPIATPPVGAAPSAPSQDLEAAVVDQARHQAREKTRTCLVCLLAVLVLLMGVLAGICFYRQYIREKVQRFNGFIPYSDRDVDVAENSWVNQHFRDGPTFFNDAWRSENNDDSDSDEDGSALQDERIRGLLRDFLNQINRDLDNPLKDLRSMESELGAIDEKAVQDKWFREDVEIQDDDDASFADIKIPDFRDGRRGRFIHDYKYNQTTIVDEDAKRCFIYPLDYETTMPPKSMIDVFVKMQTGYYFPDTTTLNKKMRVVLPQLTMEDDYVHERTAMACMNKRIYKMEPIVSGVYKRSTHESLDDQSKFAVYDGKIVEVDIQNMEQVLRYENN